jgi:hypothetical protein
MEVCDSQAENRLPDRLAWAPSSVAVPSASDKRLAVRSSLGANATRTWQLSLAVVEDRVVVTIGLVDLMQRLRDQEGTHAVAGHEV